MSLPVIILGGGGHAKVLLEVLFLRHKELLGYTSLDGEAKVVSGIARLGDDKVVLEYAPDNLRLVNGVGSIASTSSRKRLFDLFQKRGYRFESVIHPSVVMASDTWLEEGVQIMAGAVVQPGSRVGANAILNTGAVIDHDCDIGSHVHIAPGAVLSGGVRVENEAHVGTGAVVIQGLTIGAGSIIGAGAVVLQNVPPGVTVVGVPGKVIRHHVDESMLGE
jgi:sugar O-acyltransferase (sialic acid O-acetyltransferase NeuD family)